jgi:hypothetical protein
VLLVGPPDQALVGAGLPVVHTEATDEEYAPLVDVAVPELLALLYCTARGVDPGASRRMGKVTVQE